MKMDHGLVVVAIPRDDDYVWKVSSEKVPHMTLCYLGEPDLEPEQLTNMVDYVGHAASLVNRFWMSVDHRGKLGPKDADVLFFDKHTTYKMVNKFRENLLANDDINAAYQAVEQYPVWTPHLTMGYPETPAKPDKRDYGFNGVEFDKIAVWTSDFEGPTFQLKSYREDDMEVAAMMEAGGEFLEHYGVKGMRWGQHKRAGGPTGVTTTQKGRRLKTKGGQFHTPHEDAATVAVSKQIANKSGKHALSNKELQAAVTRMNLEKQFDQLNTKTGPVATGQKFVKTLLGVGKTANEVVAFTNSPAGRAVRDGVNAAASRSRRSGSGGSSVVVRRQIGA